MAQIGEEKTTLDSLRKAMSQQKKYSLGASQNSQGGFTKGGFELAKCSLTQKNVHFTNLEFRDGLDLRFGRLLTKTPSTSPCGQKHNITHALHCAKGGYIGRSVVRDTFMSLINEVCWFVMMSK